MGMQDVSDIPEQRKRGLGSESPPPHVEQAHPLDLQAAPDRWEINMTLAEAVYRRSNSLRSEAQTYQPHRQPLPTFKDPLEKRSPGRFVAKETGLSNQPHMHAVRFGRFRFVLHSRELLAAGIPLSIGNRALDVLFALIEARGELVTKDELLSRVWPNTTVEENNLQFQVSSLRKVLGEDRDLIRTVSGRGYRFIAEVTAELRPPHSAMDAAIRDEQRLVTNQVRDLSDISNSAEPASDIVGREAHLKDLIAMTAANRLATLASARETSKMRQAIDLARRTLPTVANDISGAQFKRVSETGIVTTMTVPASGLESDSNSLERMAASLDSQRLLLLLDSCEHIIDTVTNVAEALVQANAELYSEGR
jgi:DNA-binding winged helix-turn-helix (wHTH) protein